MKKLLKEYNATKRNTEEWLKFLEEKVAVSKQMHKADQNKRFENPSLEDVELLQEYETVKQMLSDINYIINWLRRGGQPNRRRGIERQGVYKREVPFEPYWIQRRKDASHYTDTIENLFQSNSEQIENEMLKEQQVKEIMKIFNDKQKEILTLKADGYTHSEIAETLDIPKGTVDVTVKRIKEKVKAEGWYML